MEDKKQPIIVKRIKKGGHPHHGGAWKVAMADFAIALMAFFMLMWLLGSVPKETLAGISDYFDGKSPVKGKVSAPTPGMSGPGGASTSMIDLGGSENITKGEGEKENKQFSEDPGQATSTMLDEKAAQEAAEKVEREKLESLMKELREAMNKSQALEPFKDQLKLDITPEGLRIQILDKKNRPMFDSGKATLKPYMIDILHEIGRFISTVPNRISISGHTDAVPYVGRDDYSNWELSSDRANAARRTLTETGMLVEKIARVVGLASSVLFDKRDPEAAINRRISIIVMNKKAELSLIEGEGGDDLNAVPDSSIDTEADGEAGDINEPPQLEAIPGADEIADEVTEINTAPQLQKLPWQKPRTFSRPPISPKQSGDSLDSSLPDLQKLPLPRPAILPPNQLPDINGQNGSETVPDTSIGTDEYDDEGGDINAPPQLELIPGADETTDEITEINTRPQLEELPDEITDEITEINTPPQLEELPEEQSDDSLNSVLRDLQNLPPPQSPVSKPDAIKLPPILQPIQLPTNDAQEDNQ